MKCATNLPPSFESVDKVIDAVCAKYDGQAKARGAEVVISPCPFCGIEGRHFAINAESGAFNCMRGKCGEKGSAWTLVKSLDLAPVTQARPKRANTGDNQRMAQAQVQDAHRAAREALESHGAAQAYLATRGIRMATARAWGLGVRSNDRGSAICFPYRRNNGMVAFLKWRSLESKDMWRWPRKSEMPLPEVEPLLGQERIRLEEPVIVTEGEFDAMALWQEGHRNVASISCGAKSWKDEWTEFLVGAPRVYSALDCDEAGDEGHAAMAAKLPSDKVARVRFDEFKDANAALLGGWNGARFRQAITEAVIPRPKILSSARAIAEELIAQRKDGRDLPPLLTGWSSFDETQRGLRIGEMSVITAHTGAGKTAWTLDLAARIAESEAPVVYASLEQRAVDTVRQLIGMTRRQHFDDIAPEQLEQCVDAVPVGFYVVREPQGDRLKAVCDAIRYAAAVHGTRLAVVDHLDYLIDPERGETRYSAANRAVQAMQSIAQECELHLLLICQPTSDSGRTKETERGASWPLLAHMAETRLTRQLPNNGFVWASDKVNRTGFLGVAKARHGAAREEVTICFKFDGFRFSDVGFRLGLNCRSESS